VSLPCAIQAPEVELDHSALDKLRALTGNDPALFSELIDSYLQEMPPLLSALHVALEQDNPAGVRQAAHPLKSTSRNFGANQLAQWAKELEEMGRAGALGGAAALGSRLDAEFARVKAALEIIRSTNIDGGM
jgi:HPt (histidine-containing phosphotransfer) domain-containing protein